MGAQNSRLRFDECMTQMRNKPIDVEKRKETFQCLLDYPNSLQDFFSLFKSNDVADIYKQNPGNMDLLLRYILNYLEEGLDASRNSLFNDTWQRGVRNCIRLLTRLMPLLLEDSKSTTIEQLFWSAKPSTTPFPSSSPLPSEPGSTPVPSLSTTSSPQPQTADATATQADNSAGNKENDPLATRLIDALLALLFVPGFTIPEESRHIALDGDEGVPITCAWAPGVGVQDVTEANASITVIRAELLKCFMSCFSEPLFRSTDDQSFEDRWLRHVVCERPQYARVVFSSLLNVVCIYDPIGWGVPYNHVLFFDQFEALTDTSLQLLMIMLHFETGKDSRSQVNHYLECLRNLKHESEFSFICQALNRLLNNPIEGNNTYLPKSQKMVLNHQEMLMLLWTLLQENKPFLTYVLRHREIVTSLLLPIVHFIYEGRNDEARVGLVHLCTFVVLVLSGERSFGVQLNEPFQSRIPKGLPLYHGNYADFLVLVSLAVISEGHSKLDSLHECLLTVIANVSPYVKTLSLVTCMKLVAAFDKFSRPAFLFSGRRKHRYVSFLLEAFNNVIQYQYEGNYLLVYAIMRSKDSFSRLANLQFPASASLPRSALSKSDTLKVVLEGIEADASAAEATVSPATETRTSSAIAIAAVAATTTVHTPTTKATAPSNTVPVPLSIASPLFSEDETPSASPVADTSPDPFLLPLLKPSATTNSENDTNELSSDPAAAVDLPLRRKRDSGSSIHISSKSGCEKSVVPGVFVPTLEWFNAWKPQLSLNTVLRVIGAILPQIPKLVTGSASDETQILEYLKSTTLVGLLPVPHPILIRRYQRNAATRLWFKTFMWGVIYLRQRTPPLFLGANVRLFIVL